jgi:hypothetical protein
LLAHIIQESTVPDDYGMKADLLAVCQILDRDDAWKADPDHLFGIDDVADNIFETLTASWVIDPFPPLPWESSDTPEEADDK